MGISILVHVCDQCLDLDTYPRIKIGILKQSGVLKMRPAQAVSRMDILRNDRTKCASASKWNVRCTVPASQKMDINDISSQIDR